MRLFRSDAEGARLFGHASEAGGCSPFNERAAAFAERRSNAPPHLCRAGPGGRQLVVRTAFPSPAHRFGDVRSRQPTGTGMGLAIAKGLVEAHAGSIWIESGRNGKGTRVLFTLPTGDDDVIEKPRYSAATFETQ